MVKLYRAVAVLVVLAIVTPVTGCATVKLIHDIINVDR
jgi:hypothetical protein